MASLIIIGSLVFLGLLYYLFLSPTSQVFGRFPYRIKTSEKIVALTFDDGPNSPFTEKILTALGRFNVKATFFLVGKNLERAPELGQAILNGGHTIGNHSYSHAFHKYFTNPLYGSEIALNQATIERITGKRPALFRPPWLFRHPWLLQTVKDHGLSAVSGLFGSELEFFQPSAESLAERALSKVKPGLILIFHDGYNAKGGNRQQTVRAINLLIPKLQAQGYQFVTVDHLLGVPAYQA